MRARLRGAGGGSVSFMADWGPPGQEPFDLAFDLLQLAGYYESARVPLEMSAEAISEGIENRFQTETDPDGTPWQELTEAHLAWKQKKGYREDILQMTGALYDAAVDKDRIIITNDTLVYDPSGLPFYGGIHQAGSPSTNLPQRRFVGIDVETELKIIAIFDQWFGEGLEIIDEPGPSGGSGNWMGFMYEAYEGDPLYYVHPSRTGFIYERHPAGTPGGLGGRFKRAFRP